MRQWILASPRVLSFDSGRSDHGIWGRKSAAFAGASRPPETGTLPRYVRSLMEVLRNNTVLESEHHLPEQRRGGRLVLFVHVIDTLARLIPDSEIRGYVRSRRGLKSLNHKDLQDLEELTIRTRLCIKFFEALEVFVVQLSGHNTCHLLRKFRNPGLLVPAAFASRACGTHCGVVKRCASMRRCMPRQVNPLAYFDPESRLYKWCRRAGHVR